MRIIQLSISIVVLVGVLITVRSLFGIPSYGISGIYTLLGEDNVDSMGLVEYPVSIGRGKTNTNPGCISRKLDDYRPNKEGISYHHPPVIHYAKLSKSGKAVSLSFRDYMSMVSFYKFLKPERILIHAYGDIVGKYWDLVKKWKDTSVQVNQVLPLIDIGGKAVEYVAHEADYIRLVALLKFGGIISDFDVIVINGTKLKEMQDVSDCIISKEEHYLNIGFVSCIRNSSYIQRWIESYHSDFKPSSYLYNSAFKPKSLLKDGRYCYDCYVEDTICSPSSRREDQVKWLRQNGVQWKGKTAAHYFVKSGFTFDDDRLLKEKHSLGEMLQYVDNAPYSQ